MLPQTLLVRLLALLLAAAPLAACGGSDSATLDASSDAPVDATPVPSEITEFLDTVPGLSYSEESSVYAGYRRFVVSYVQPVDHSDPGGRTFTQRAILHHRDRARPFVLYTSGYYLFSDDYLSELSSSMLANQIDVEQRFFSPSTPNPTSAADYQFLRIAQAAADHHRFVLALKPYYNRAWLSTGHSKGGMTSVYHRHFYPDDVDATVPYVTPISFAPGDTRYHAFFDQVATPTCRQALRDIQREMLTRRAAMLTRLQAAAGGATFDRFGGIEQALEDGITGMPWSFFQSGTASNCPSIPSVAASDDQIFNFLLNSGGISSDAGLDFFASYYYQAEAELGYPSIPTDHLSDLLQFPSLEVDALPSGVSATHDPAPMAAVDAWVRNDASQLLFIYGEFDPWFGGAFTLGAQTVDSLKLVVAGANHGALIGDLGAADQGAALDAIERWTGVRPDIFPGRQTERPLIPSVRVRMH